MTATIDWQAMARLADPLADRTVAAIIGAHCGPEGPTPEGIARLGWATRLMAGWTTNGSLRDWTAPAGSVDADLAMALRAYLDEGAVLPAWARTADIECAEDVFMTEGPMSCVLLFCASLPECYVLPHLAEVLHAAGQLELHTEHRIRQTAAMVFPVMMKGGLTRPEGGGVAAVLKVRLIHATIRHLILHGAPDSVTGPVAAAPLPANATMHQAMAALGWDVQRQGMPCSQLELAYTLLTFSYVFLRGMRSLGLPLTERQEHACLHAWNVAGHVLGIHDNLMPQGMGEARAWFEAIQAQARTRPAVTDVRPGLGRALIDTMARTIRLPVLRHVPVPLTCLLIGKHTAADIGADERVGFLPGLVLRAGLFTTRAIDAVARLVLPQFSLTRMVTRVVGYHLLTRFLLDQTRPLTLPAELLEPMHATVAGWQQDPRAPGWLNRLEDRITTVGAWKART